MTHIVRETGRPEAIAANGSVTLGGGHMLGFLCVVSGTLTVTLIIGNMTGNPTSVTAVDAVPVTAGIYTPIPITWPSVPQGCVVTLAGGAKGTLIV